MSARNNMEGATWMLPTEKIRRESKTDKCSPSSVESSNVKTPYIYTELILAISMRRFLERSHGFSIKGRAE
jgi:hypothetical protein